MATLDELGKALRAAHKAGDTLAARRLAAEWQSLNTKTQAKKAPIPEQIGRAISDQLRIGSNAVTLGARDKLAQFVGGDSPEIERIKTQEASERAGTAGLAMEMLGLMLPGGLASKGVAKIAPAIAGPGLPSTVAREGAAGGLLGTIMALNSDESLTQGAAAGIIGGGAGGAAGKIAGDLLSKLPFPGLKDTRIPRQTLDEMRAYKDDMYEQLEKAGIRYDPKDIGNLSQSLRQRLVAEGADPELHAPAVKRAKRFAKRQPTTLKELDDQRQLIARDVKGPHGVSHMGGAMDDVIREFIETVPPQHATTAQARNTIHAARDANRKLKVREGVEGAVERNRNARTEGEGPFRNLLNRGTRGMADKEVELLENVVRGEGWEQALSNRLVDASAKLGSFGSGATAGGILAGPPGAVVGGLSAMVLPPLAKRAAKGYRDKNIEALLDELGGGQTIPSWLKKFLKNKGAIGGGLLAGEVQER